MRGLFAAALLGASIAARAAAPAWIVQAGAEAAPPSRGIVVLVESVAVTYVTPDRTRLRARYAARLTAETARNDARFAFPYNVDTDHILAVRAWVVSADGRKVRNYGRGDCLDTPAQLSNTVWNEQRLVSFDGSEKVDLGGMVGFEIEAEQPAGVLASECRFLPSHYTVRAEFEVTPPAGYNLIWHRTSAALPDPGPGMAPGSLRWILERIDPGPAATVPKDFLANPRAVAVRAVLPGATITWGESARMAAGVIAPRTESSPAVLAEAASLTAGKAGRWEKIRALADFTQKQIVYLSVTIDKDCLAGWRPHPPEEVLRNRFGDCKDKAALLVALLHAIGENGRLLLANPTAPQAIEAEWPTLGFDHAIVGISAGADAPPDWPRIDGGALGPMIVFDPTDTTTPLGLLSQRDQGGWTLIVDAAHGTLVRLPQAEGPAHTVDRTMDARLDENGTLAAEVDEDCHGQAAAEAYANRAAVDSPQMAEHLEAFLRRTNPLLHDFSWRDQWSPENCRYQLHFQFKADRYARNLGDNLLAVSPQATPDFVAFPEWRTSAEGVSWLWTGELRVHVRMALPSGYGVEEMPDDWDRHGAVISCSLHYAVDRGVVVYESQVSVRPGFYDRKQYEAIRSFLAKIVEAQRRPILLHRMSSPGSEPVATAPAKG